jgi:hypothetical protein
LIFVQNRLEIVQNPLKSVQNCSATKKGPFSSLIYWEKMSKSPKHLDFCLRGKMFWTLFEGLREKALEH